MTQPIADNAKKVRSSNFELLRLVAMLLVLGVHANFLTLGNVTAAEYAAGPDAAFARTFAEAVCLVCVDVFVLISGWFGIRPRRLNVMSFVFVVLFWRVAIGFWVLSTARVTMGPDFLVSLLPGYKEWFTVAYGLLILFAPLLNSFIENRPRRHFEIFLIAFFVLVTIFGFIAPFGVWGSSFDSGYSFLGVFGLYALGRYMRLNEKRLANVGSWVWVILFVGCALVNTLLYLSPLMLGMGKGAYRMFTSYISPLVIVQTVSLFMIFSHFKFRSAFINSAAAGAFAVYLIHCNSYVLPSFMASVRWAIASTQGWLAYPAVLGVLLVVFVACVVVDRIRLWAWRFIESKIK